MDPYKELKETAFKANMELPRRGVVIYTFGNVSACDRDKGVFAIKPSGVAYDRLSAGDMVIVDFDNRVVDGKLKPSSDTKTHTVLYRHFETIGGVCHTHSPYAVAWAQAQKPVPIYGTTHADHLADDIPCTQVMTEKKIKGDYEQETGYQIVNTFKKLSFNEIEMVLVACHGPFAWGKDAYRAVYNAVVLEELAKMALWTQQINPHVPRLKKSLVNKHYRRKHGKDAYYGQPEKHNR